MAGAKALGLVSRIVTRPLWSLIEDRNVHILEMNSSYSKLTDFLNAAATNIPDFMTGKILPFGPDTNIKQDAVYASILQPWQHDNKVQVFLSIMLPAINKCAKKLFKDHLPDGQWENVTEQMKVKTKGTHKHNKYAESVFGYLDRLLRVYPSISVLASEAYIVFTANKTKAWLESKSEAEKQRLIQNAQKGVPATRAAFKERKKEIERQQVIAWNEKMRHASELEAKRLEKLECYTNEIIYYGLWQSQEQIDCALEQIKTITEKKKSLKAQLNFRNYVLQQKPENRSVYRFSTTTDGKARQFSIEQLTENLRLLVNHAFTIPERGDQAENIPILTGKRVKHTFKSKDSNDNFEFWNGKVISQVYKNNIYSSRQKYFSNPIRCCKGAILYDRFGLIFTNCA